MASKSQQSRAARTAALIQEQDAKERRRNLIVVGAIVAVLAVIAVATYFGVRNQDTTGDKATAPTGADGYSIVWGEPDAPTTIKVYEDFQCPACSDWNAAVKDELDQAVADGKVKVDYRMVSFLDRASTNDSSSRAHNAALVVLDTAGVEAFHTFYETLYADQPAEGGPGQSDEQLIESAVAAGADKAEIEGPIGDKVYDQWITNATEQMSKDGVTGTPTVFIDGEKVDDPVQGVLDALK